MLSRVTPCHFLPPLSPFQYAMQGGDCGSSIWRSGGGPTQLFTRFSGTLECDGLGLGLGDAFGLGGGDGCPAASATPCPGGACLMTCCALGANSAAVGGAAVATCSSSGTRTASTATAMPRLVAPELRAGRRNRRVLLAVISTPQVRSCRAACGPTTTRRREW